MGNRPVLTHLRLAGCALDDRAFASLLVGMPGLEVFDISSCRLIEVPFEHITLPDSAISEADAILGLSSAAASRIPKKTSAFKQVRAPVCEASVSLEDAAAAIAQASARPASVAPKLRLLAVGQTALAGQHIGSTCQIVHALAPSVRVLPTALDLYGSYQSLPP